MRRTIKPAAALAVAALITACGAAARAPADKTPVTKPLVAVAHVAQPHTAVVLDYSRCMRAHGIKTFPNPVDGHILLTPSSGINMSSPRFIAAEKTCARYGPRAPKKPASPSAAETADTSSGTGSTSRFAAWLASQARSGQFSGSVLVVEHGRVALDRGYGAADRATHIANSAATRFCIASIGKLFTAVAIGQLAERGELSLSAPVGNYVAGLPKDTGQITIGQLLDMTGGLGNVVLGRAKPPRELAQMVALIARERPLQRPGAHFLYSNDDYILLGDVVQRVSGMTYLRYVRTHIFKPAGMTGVGYTTYVPARVADMAHGYALVGERYRDISDQPQIANPSGGAYATTLDLYRFALALLHHRLLSAAMTATLLKPRVDSPQPGGPPVDEYSYGFAYQRIDGVTFVGHNGGTPGYEGQLDIYPRSGDVAVVLTNQDDTMIAAIQRSEQMLTATQA
jgi:CubicO group peptidase (beta-lactamase class C family)